MERNRQSFNRQPGPEQAIDERVEQLQRHIDETMHKLANVSMPDTEREGMIIDLRNLIEEKIEGMNELEPSLGETIRVSGSIQRAYYNELEERSAIESVSVQSEAMESAGFVVYPLETGQDEPRQTVGHLFRNYRPVEASSSNGLIHQATAYYSFAPYRSVTIEKPWLSDEVLDHLETTAPDILQEVEYRLLNAESSPQAILSLAGLGYSESSLDETTRACLVTYVNQILDLQKSPLLRVDVDDSYNRTVLGMPLSLSLKQGSASLAAKPEELTLYQNEKDETQLYRWSVRAGVQAADSANQNLVDCPDFAVPINNITNISQLSLDN